MEKSKCIIIVLCVVAGIGSGFLTGFFIGGNRHILNGLAPGVDRTTSTSVEEASRTISDIARGLEKQEQDNIRYSAETSAVGERLGTISIELDRAIKNDRGIEETAISYFTELRDYIRESLQS